MHPFEVTTIQLTEDLREQPVVEQQEVLFRLDHFGDCRLHYKSDGYVHLVQLATGKSVTKISLHVYVFDRNRNTNPSNHPDYPNSRQEYGLVNPGKYIMTTSSKEPKLLNLQVRFLAFAPEEEKLSVRFFMSPLNGFLPENSELVVRYSTELDSGDEFFTDSNGFYEVPRKAWKNGNNIESNYYPISNFCFIKDSKDLFTVNVDRAEGCTSPSMGVLELLIHRKTSTSDNRGNKENMQDDKKVSIEHSLTFEKIHAQEKSFRRLQSLLDYPPLVYYLKTKKQNPNFELSKAVAASGYQDLLSWNLRISFDTITGSEVVIKIANTANSHKSINLQRLVQEILGVQLQDIQELSVDLNNKMQDLIEENESCMWENKISIFEDRKILQMNEIKIKGMDIRAFQLNFS